MRHRRGGRHPSTWCFCDSQGGPFCPSAGGTTSSVTIGHTGRTLDVMVLGRTLTVLRAEAGHRLDERVRVRSEPHSAGGPAITTALGPRLAEIVTVGVVL